MSLADTYFLAARARSKLTKEASRHDHDLRVLVSHANLLDSLMDSLAKSSRERKTRFAPLPEKEQYEEEEFDDDSASDSDDYETDSDEEEDDDELVFTPSSGTVSYRTMPTIEEVPSLSYSSEEDAEEEEEEADSDVYSDNSDSDEITPIHHQQSNIHNAKSMTEPTIIHHVPIMV